REAPEPRPGRRPAPEAGVDKAAVQPLDAPQSGPAGGIAGGDTASAGLPEVALDSMAPAVPDAPETGGGIAVGSDAPVMQPPAFDVPDAPAVEAEPALSTDPAQPPAPAVPEAETALVADPEAEAEPEAATPEDTDGDDVPEAEDRPAPAGAEEPDAPQIAAMAPSATEGPSLPGAEIPDEESPLLEAAPGTEAGAEDAPPPVVPRGTGAGTTFGAPAGSFTDRDAAVPVNRPGAAPEVAEGDEAEAVEAPPVRRFAAEPVAAGDQPRMAVVLIDDGSGPLGPDALDAFPFPVSFAVDPGLPDAAARMRAYREKGFEVFALAGLPDGATARDAEVTLEAALSALPEAVGVLEAPDATGGLGDSRAVSDQVAAALAATGHGLLMLDDGLNTARTLAARAGVPSASVYRDFDGEGQDPRVQRRFLDQAAFRARQEGSVVMLGRLRADTVSALLLWGLQDRAAQVALVPASQVLEAEGS
ncbi:divergent polysaccharide deacteylase family protein, partial [Roseivivax isoporae]